MRVFRRHLLIRLPLAGLLMVAWFVVTNHCVLGMMSPTAKAAGNSGGCCEGKTNPGHDSRDDLGPCCNIKVTMAPAKAVTGFDASKFQVQVFAILQMLAAQIAQPAPAFVLDHGPPRAVSFVESVLQHSLLSHAPPFVA